MSLGQWLNAKVGQTDDLNGASAARPMATPSLASSGQDIAEIHRRLDSITQQINQLSPARSDAKSDARLGGAPAAGGTTNGLANQLNDAISRLDSRLARLSQGTPRRPSPPIHTEVPPAPAYAAPQPAAAALDLTSAVAEINARRGELDAGNYRQNGTRPVAPPNLASLERQLHQITSQIETLRRPDTLDPSIAVFREELAEIRRSLNEALPRRAIDSLETEIRSLAQRIDRSREDGGDRDTLASIEHALNDIYNVVRTLTPAEQLAGYDAAIRKLSDKIDLIVRSSPDGGVAQMQEAIAALRGIVSNIATNDAINHLSEHLQALNEKVDRLAASNSSDTWSALEQRLAHLTSALEARSQGDVADGVALETAVRALSDRIDHLGQVDSASSMAQIEQRIAYLIERLETTEPRVANTSRVEENLGEILRHLEYQRQAIAGLGESSSGPNEPIEREIVDSIRRELVEVRDSQVESDRRTQDTLEAVHSTLGHVVDRLSMIEGDLKRVQSVPLQPELPQPAVPPAPYPETYVASSPSTEPPPPLRPELPNPVTMPRVADLAPVMPIDTSELRAASNLTQPPADPAPSTAWARPTPIDSSLPPDYPLEPGARSQSRSATDRIAAAGIAPTEPAAEGRSKSNFIAAARRAAQAAAAAAATEKTGRVAMATDAARAAAAKAGFSLRGKGQPSGEAKPSRLRPLLVGFSVIVIVLSGFRLAMNYLDGGDNAPPAEKTTVTVPPADTAPAAEKQKSEAAPPSNPLLTSPTAVERQSLIVPTPAAQPLQLDPNVPAKVGSAPLPANGATVTPVADSEVTGSVMSQASRDAQPVANVTDEAVGDKLPDVIAGPVLRAAALRGEPAAAFEIAVRYAEGRGVPANYGEAAKWYDRAAQKGIVPAMFRLGTILEKGLNGKKDVDAARRYYVLAAERGNAKAMHNLAVLDADGGGKGPNYKSAAVWFRKAADHGIADSQYNLGILYARGIGVEQNLAESFKWFSLAAAQGDSDAAHKRDDVAKRLDQQSLAAAKLAIQTFAPEPQPDDAINVAGPAGGWDTAAPAGAPKQAAKSAAKPAKQHAAAR
jgi:localization factor PodJL